MRRQRVGGGAIPLAGSLIDVLLTGHVLSADEVAAREMDEAAYGAMAGLIATDEDLADAWHAHRPALILEWRRRGGVGPCWAERTYDDGRR